MDGGCHCYLLLTGCDRVTGQASSAPWRMAAKATTKTEWMDEERRSERVTRSDASCRSVSLPAVASPPQGLPAITSSPQVPRCATTGFPVRGRLPILLPEFICGLT